MIEKPQLVSFHALPLFDDRGDLATLKVTAIFKILSLQPDGKQQKPTLKTVEFDLVQQGGQTVILGNQLVEFGDIGADLIGVANFAYKLANPDPLPPPIVRRKTLRETK